MAEWVAVLNRIGYWDSESFGLQRPRYMSISFHNGTILPFYSCTAYLIHAKYLHAENIRGTLLGQLSRLFAPVAGVVASIDMDDPHTVNVR
jgi:hypothetical protein